MTNKLPEVKRTERGWAGHLICGHRCRFHLNTLLEHKETRIVVSTVGMMFNDGKPDCIGSNRHYETMAFEAEEEGEFVEADVQKQISFSSNWAIEDPFKDNEAVEMHENAVQEIICNYFKEPDSANNAPTDKVKEALDSVKYHLGISDYFNHELALGDMKEAAQNLVNAIEENHGY